MALATKTKSVQQTDKMPVQINTFLSWPEILKLLNEYQSQVVLNVLPQTRSHFTPEEESVLLENTGLYTEQFIKKNERAKSGSGPEMLVCNSLAELKTSLE